MSSISTSPDVLPNFHGDTEKEQWYYDHVGPRDRTEVCRIIYTGLHEMEVYSGLTTRVLRRTAYQEHAKEFQKYFDRIVFTDGSESGDGMAGYGAWWGKEPGQSLHGPIPEEQTSSRSELYAIYQVLLQDPDIIEAVRIETDCVGVFLELVDRYSGKKTKHKELCDQILEVLALRPGPIGLGYVPGHASIHGNVAADRLATLASADALLSHPGFGEYN